MRSTCITTHIAHAAPLHRITFVANYPHYRDRLTDYECVR